MGSTRLPGKVMRLLNGESVLGHVLRRAQKIPGVDYVCCATVDSSESDPILIECESLGVKVYQGSELDVLRRYTEAASWLKADYILRITSDCPLIDPDICRNTLSLFMDNAADYASNNMPPSWPHGLDCEVISREWLEYADMNASDPQEREHVTNYIREHESAKRVNLHCPHGDLSGYRWTLDTPEDWNFFESLFRHLGDAVSVKWEEVLDVINHHPELSNINTLGKFQGFVR